MAKKDKKRRFKGKTGRNAAKQSRGTQLAHLNLPKGVSVFREESKTRVNLDIIPYEVTAQHHMDRDDEYEIAIPGSLWYKKPYLLHRNIGSNNESVVCPGTVKQKCPICEYRAQLLKDGADWSDEPVKALKASMRNLYVVIPKENKNYEEKPHIWDISQFLFQGKLNEEIQENEEYETFPDLEEGFTLRIRFSEESFGQNKFADTSRIDFIDRKEPYDESILDKIPSLDEVIVIPAYKTVEVLFFGGLEQDEVEDEVDDDEQEEKNKKPADTRRTHRAKPEPEPEDDDEGKLEEEDEEEDKKLKKSTRSKDKQGDKKKDKGRNKGKCPHGYKFGEDCEEYDECDECDEWETCMDESDN